VSDAEGRATTAAAAATPGRRGPLGLLLTAAPGIVFLLSSIGPSDLVSNAAAGANFGYTLLWTLLVVGLARFIILEASARYVLATGESLLQGYQRAAGWSPWVFIGAIVLRRHLSNLYHVLLLGLSLEFLVGSEAVWARNVFALGSCALAFVVMYGGGYASVERISTPLATLLGLTVFVTMLWAQPQWGAVASGVLQPSLPEATETGFSVTMVLLMLVGTGVGSLSNLKYSAFVFEHGWRDPSLLRRQRMDLIMSLTGAFLIAAMLQVAAGSILRPEGLTLSRPEDLLPLFTAALGDVGRVLMAVGLWVTVFTTYIGSNTGYSLLVCDSLAAVNAGMQTPEQRTRLYRGLLVFFCLSPLYVLATPWTPVPLVLASAVLQTLAVPLVTVLLLRITTDRARLGAYANGPVATAAMVLVTIGSLVVTWQGAVELIARFR